MSDLKEYGDVYLKKLIANGEIMIEFIVDDPEQYYSSRAIVSKDRAISIARKLNDILEIEGKAP